MMSNHPDERIERRRHLRIAPKGSVTLRVGEHSRRGRIVNLSQGGVFIAPTVGAPERLLGRTAQIELRLDGQLAKWYPASGQILRVDSAGIAVELHEVSPPLVRLIDEMSTASFARLRVMSMVLVDPDASRRSVMAAAFRLAGCTVIETATPLEAIVRLGELDFEPDVIAVADSTPGTIADDMRRFVVRDHPRVKLVTIGNDLMHDATNGHWLSSDDATADLMTRVREVLGCARRPTRL
jgi:hypothetical protein